jgi:hypothetical protein
MARATLIRMNLFSSIAGARSVIHLESSIVKRKLGTSFTFTLAIFHPEVRAKTNLIPIGERVAKFG